MTHKSKVTTVVQGDVAISDDPSVVLGTVLGSCISVCIFDPIAHIGGMNHFLLPGSGEGHDETAMRFGVHSMEMLVNGILKAGGSRHRLLCKAFGGAAVVPTLGRIGQENISFIQHYLSDEGINCISQSLGGTQARRVRFWPTTGRAQQNLVHDAQSIGRQEVDYSRREAEAEQKWARECGSDIELF
ncbi:chemotaxis protein [Gluconacetobacter johannae DSM 13595]|uniref:chemotaxis protein CheD n=2 Tax=Gluconacetobacter johannae TaxID=112140 RepID=UPI002156C2C5|nr:chemotaxis protein [Gluconacetobacter johannae DSM 13595]